VIKRRAACEPVNSPFCIRVGHAGTPETIGLGWSLPEPAFFGTCFVSFRCPRGLWVREVRCGPRLRPRPLKFWPSYADSEKMTERENPVVVLDPTSSQAFQSSISASA
jgi:hypothetical protein